MARQLDREKMATLMFLETCLVDKDGRVNLSHLNVDDRLWCEKMSNEGFIGFGRIAHKYISGSWTHWVTFSDEAWELAHFFRRERAARCMANRDYVRTKEPVDLSPCRLEFMTEPQIAEHVSRQLRMIKRCHTEDTIGSMLIIFQEDGITQYGATVDPETAPAALRETADKIEARETVKRDGPGDIS